MSAKQPLITQPPTGSNRSCLFGMPQMYLVSPTPWSINTSMEAAGLAGAHHWRLSHQCSSLTWDLRACHCHSVSTPLWMGQWTIGQPTLTSPPAHPTGPLYAAIPQQSQNGRRDFTCHLPSIFQSNKGFLSGDFRTADGGREWRRALRANVGFTRATNTLTLLSPKDMTGLPRPPLLPWVWCGEAYHTPLHVLGWQNLDHHHTWSSPHHRPSMGRRDAVTPKTGEKQFTWGKQRTEAKLWTAHKNWQEPGAI